MIDSDVIEEAKCAIFDYYSHQELYDQGYLIPNSKFTDEDSEKLDVCQADEIELEKFDWEECLLLEYAVDRDRGDSSIDFGLVSVGQEHIYFDRQKTNNDSIAEFIEAKAKPIAQAIFLKTSLDEKLATHDDKPRQVRKI